MLKTSVYGGGRPVTLLGGCGVPSDVLAPLAKRLAERRRVLLVAYPGYDGSSAFDGRYTMETAERLLVETLAHHDALDSDLVGMSMGAYLALALASGGRVRPRSVVLLGGYASLSAPERAAFDGFVDMARSGDVPSGLLPARVLSPAYAERHPDVAARIDGWLARVDRGALAAELRAVAESADLMPRLAAIDAEVVARVGALDVVHPPPCSYAIAKACSSARVDVVDGAAHLLVVEDCEATTAAIVAAIE